MAKSLTFLPPYRVLLELIRQEKPTRMFRCIQENASTFDVSRDTIGRIWKRAKASHARHSEIVDFVLPKSGKCAKNVYDSLEKSVNLSLKPLHRRMTNFNIAAELTIPCSTVFDVLARDPANNCKGKTSVVKLCLTKDNEAARKRYAMKKLLLEQTQNRSRLFSNLKDEVYIDEKWF